MAAVRRAARLRYDARRLDAALTLLLGFLYVLEAPGVEGWLGCHTSAFTKYETKVPLILYLRGQSHQEVDRLTSHVDVVPTLLGLLGYTSPPSVYSQGFSLLENQHRDAVVSCGWDSCGVIGAAHTVVFSTETYNAYLFDVRDGQYRRIADFRPILERESAALLHVLEGFRTFNK